MRIIKMMKYIVIDGFSGNKGGMRNLGEEAHNKEFDTLDEAIKFVKGAKWSIRTLKIDPGFSRSIGRKELNPNLAEDFNDGRKNNGAVDVCTDEIGGRQWRE